MPTINCANCHNAIDEHAVTCAHCQKLNTLRKRRLSLYEALQLKDKTLANEILRDMRAGHIVNIT